MNREARPKVLVLSRNYPNKVTPILGLWVEGLVRHLAALCEIKVVAPVPYCPPLPGLPNYTKFRAVAKQRNRQGIDIFHPRFLVGPGNTTYNLEGSSYYWSIVRQIDRLREEFRFDVIHANFGYPDGVVAARLARRYGVPFIITEHASWTPWMDNHPKVRRLAVRASEESAYHIAVSRFARATIAQFTGERDNLRVVPNGVDVSVFTPPAEGERFDPHRILYVGLMRHVKGIDVLLRAMSLAVERNPQLRLVLVGGGVYRDYLLQVERLKQMTHELGIDGHVEFAGMKTPAEVARYMRESALLVLPSRKETFGAVLIEAMASGTPVVATRCGGTEDVVNEEVGRLVPKEDAPALADAMLDIIAERSRFNPAALSAYARQNFSWAQIARQTFELYQKAVAARRN